MSENKFAPDTEILEIIMGEEPDTLESRSLVGSYGPIVPGGSWFEGLPGWMGEKEAEQDFGIGFWDDVISIVSFWDAGPDSFDLEGRTYTRKAHLAPFGERECPYHGDDSEDSFSVDGRCYYCEQDREEGHGYLYLGEFAINIYAAPPVDEDA